MQIIKVERAQMEELLRQNKDMKEDIYILLSSVNYLKEFIPKDIEEGPINAPALMFKMMPLIGDFMKQMKSPEMLVIIENLKKIHSKYAGQIQQPNQQIEIGPGEAGK